MDDVWEGAASQPRFTQAEIQKRLLKAAERSVARTGLTVGFAHLNMEMLAERAKVPRASAYRAFRDREELLTALLLRLLKSTEKHGAAYDPETIRVAEKVVAENQFLLGTRDGRDRVLREAVRLGVWQNFTAMSQSVRWKTYMALSVGVPNLSVDRQHEVFEKLRLAESNFVVLMSEFYDRLLVVLRRRLRSDCTTQQISAAGSAVVEGLLQRSFVNTELVAAPIMMPALTEKPVPWHLAAVAFLGIVEQMTEPDE